MQKYKVVLISEQGNKTVLAVKNNYHDAIEVKKMMKTKFTDQIVIQPASYYEM